MKIEKDSIAIGYVHPNVVTERFAFSLADACRVSGNRIAGIISASSPRQEVARNAVIEKFLEGPCEWLMWIDTDMVFKPDAPLKLRDTAKRNKADAVAGLCFIYKRGSNSVVPSAYLWDENEGAFAEIVNYESGSCIPIDGCGSAFVLVHRRCFEDKGAHWHHNWMQHPASGSDMGHDLAFFWDVTQIQKLTLLWDTSVQAGHIKHFTLDEDSFRQYQEMNG